MLVLLLVNVAAALAHQTLAVAWHVLRALLSRQQSLPMTFQIWMAGGLCLIMYKRWYRGTQRVLSALGRIKGMWQDGRGEGRGEGGRGRRGGGEGRGELGGEGDQERGGAAGGGG